MRISSNALALFCIAASVPTVDAFVSRQPPFKIATSLNYIKEGYDTGIKPDFLKKKKNDEDKIIDVVVTDENFTAAPKKAAATKTATPHVDDTETKSQKRGASVFPDQFESAPPVASIFDTTSKKVIEGGSLRTWTIAVPEVNHAQVLLQNANGDPLHAQIDVWDGPDQAPMKLAVYCANTLRHPFSCVVPTPGYSKQSIGIKNTGPQEFPIEAVVIADAESVHAQRQQQQQQYRNQYSSHQSQLNNRDQYSKIDPNNPGKSSFFNPNPADARLDQGPEASKSGFGKFADSLRSLGELRRIDASPNNEEEFVFDNNVDSVQVLIETNGLACQARIEVTYGDDPDQMQQVVEVSIEDGKERPFFAVIGTPLNCRSKVRVVNLDPYLAFPLKAFVEPYTIGNHQPDSPKRNTRRPQIDLDVIDAAIQEEEEQHFEDYFFIDQGDEYYYDEGDTFQQDTFQHYSIPDITVPATDADYASYNFDEELFFASY